MHQLNKPEGQGCEIKGKASAAKMKKRCHFPLPSAGAELALAATGRSLSMWSSCFYCSCQRETGRVFGRVWGCRTPPAALGQLCLLPQKIRASVLEKSRRSPVSRQLWEFEPWNGKLPARLLDHNGYNSSNPGHGETHAFVTEEEPCLSLVQKRTAATDSPCSAL